MTADWTNLILGPELHRGRLGHLLRATRSKGPGPAELVLRLTDARLEPALRGLVTRESALAVRVVSPFVVAHEPVAQDAARPYSLMARIDGLSLHALLLGTPAHEAARLLLPAALDAIEGLVALHAASDDEGPLHAVHQAPVPRHVVVGVDGVARLVDFTQAVSRAHPYVPALQSLLHAEELAPEQLVRPEHVDARTDVFIAADTFFRVLTGTPALASSAASRSRPPGSGASGRAEAPLSVPPELERVLSWALAADPAGRPGSAQALLDALRDALTHTDPLATREELGARVRRLQGERSRAAHDPQNTHQGSARARPAVRSSAPVREERAGSLRPFASTYALRTGAEPRDTDSAAPPAAPAARRSATPAAPSPGPRASSVPPRRDYWFALYRDEHSPGESAPPAAAPTAHESTRPGFHPPPPGPLGPDDTGARQRAELGPVLYLAPPWSSPPPVLSPPFPEPGGMPARTKAAVLTNITLLAVAVTTMVFVGLDSPTSSASQRAPRAAPAPAASPSELERSERAPVEPPSADLRPPSADLRAPSAGRKGVSSSAGVASDPGTAPRAPSAVTRPSAPNLPPPARRAGAKAARQQGAPEPRTPTLTREDFLLSEPSSP